MMNLTHTVMIMDSLSSLENCLVTKIVSLITMYMPVNDSSHESYILLYSW